MGRQTDHPKVSILRRRKIFYASFLHPTNRIRVHRSFYTNDPVVAASYARTLSLLLRGGEPDMPEVVKLMLDTSPEANLRREEMRLTFLKGRRTGRGPNLIHPLVSLGEHDGIYHFVFKHPVLNRQVRRTMRLDHAMAVHWAKELSKLLVTKATTLPADAPDELRRLWEQPRCPHCGKEIGGLHLWNQRMPVKTSLNSYPLAELLEEVRRRAEEHAAIPLA